MTISALHIPDDVIRYIYAFCERKEKQSLNDSCRNWKKVLPNDYLTENGNLMRALCDIFQTSKSLSLDDTTLRELLTKSLTSKEDSPNYTFKKICLLSTACIEKCNKLSLDNLLCSKYIQNVEAEDDAFIQLAIELMNSVPYSSKTLRKATHKKFKEVKDTTDKALQKIWASDSYYFWSLCDGEQKGSDDAWKEVEMISFAPFVQKNREVVKEILKRNPEELRFAHPKFQDDAEIVSTAVFRPTWSKPLKYASTRLRNSFLMQIGSVFSTVVVSCNFLLCCCSEYNIVFDQKIE